jgi:hypothetical protein
LSTSTLAAWAKVRDGNAKCCGNSTDGGQAEWKKFIHVYLRWKNKVRLNEVKKTT